MFVQAKQVPVDAQLGACDVQELTSLYLARIYQHLLSFLHARYSSFTCHFVGVLLSVFKMRLLRPMDRTILSFFINTKPPRFPEGIKSHLSFLPSPFWSIPRRYGFAFYAHLPFVACFYYESIDHQFASAEIVLYWPPDAGHATHPHRSRRAGPTDPGAVPPSGSSARKRRPHR